jgi:hypothetical protein
VDVTIASSTPSRIRQNASMLWMREILAVRIVSSQVEVQVEWVSYKLLGIMPSENSSRTHQVVLFGIATDLVSSRNLNGESQLKQGVLQHASTYQCLETVRSNAAEPILRLNRLALNEMIIS